MLCSVCNKNAAIIFTNEVIEGKTGFTGYCYACAKEKGINPVDTLAKQANLSKDELQDLSAQFEQVFSEFTEQLNLDDIDNGDNGEENPISAMFSKVLGGSDNSNTESTSERKKVKVEKKTNNNKKKRILDTYRYKFN